MRFDDLEAVLMKTCKIALRPQITDFLKRSEERGTAILQKCVANYQSTRRPTPKDENF
jgi:hypothetical protein